MFRCLTTFLLAGFLLSGCASSSMSRADVPARLQHAVARVAILPSSGQIGDAIGAALIKQDMRVIRSWELSELMARLNIKEAEIDKPGNLALLKAEGIDVLLSAQSIGALDHPDSVTALLRSTHTGQYVADLTWRNAFGGLPGSPADMIMRKPLSSAVSEMGGELIKTLKP